MTEPGPRAAVIGSRGEQARINGSTAAFVQARLGSRRLPHKVLLPLVGEPMVWRLVERLRESSALDTVVVGTTTEPSDDDLEAFCRDRGIPVHRGPVDDIVERMCGAAAHVGAERLVRAWGDSPLIDPGMVTMAVQRVESERLDYFSTGFPRRTLPGGLDFEVYSVSALERIRAGTSERFFREYPLEYVRDRDDFPRGTLEWKEDLSHLTLTVDYPEDLALVDRIYREMLTAHGPAFELEQVLHYLEAHPDLESGRDDLPRNVEYLEEKQRREKDRSV